MIPGVSGRVTRERAPKVPLEVMIWGRGDGRSAHTIVTSRNIVGELGCHGPPERVPRAVASVEMRSHGALEQEQSIPRTRETL